MDYATLVQYGFAGVLIIVLVFFYRYIQSEQAKSDNANIFIREQATRSETRSVEMVDKVIAIANASVNAAQKSATAIQQISDCVEEVSSHLAVYERGVTDAHIEINKKLDKIYELKK